MRVGLLADIHANKPALDAVLAAMPDVDALACAGDVIGYNPWPGACIDTLRTREIPTIKGNHDRMLVTGQNFWGNDMASAGIDHARRTLTTAQTEWLAARPDACTLFDNQVRVVHGHPDNPDRYTYPEEFTPSLLDETPVLVMGHTHIQHHERYPEGIIVNPGSVGQPRDGDPRAAYATLDLDALTVEEHRVPYDIEEVRDAIEAADLPPGTGTRLLKGR